MSGRKWASAGVVAALVVGYGALDAHDVVPGVLTIDHGNEPRTVTVGGHAVHPLDKPASAPALPASMHGSAPSAAAVKKAMDAGLKNSWFGNPTTMTVLDADTGATLYDRNAGKATTPASVTKLLTAFAISHSKLAPSQRLTTRAMLDGSTVSLVAGGDMTLDAGSGGAEKIVGHAGLQDLAQQTAATLKRQGRTKVTLDTNTSYAPGPSTAKGWGSNLLTSGFTARISMLALASDRADDKSPAAADPTKNAAQAFVKALGKQGIKATYGRDETSAPRGTTVGSVESAPVIDLLGAALQDSDNSMVESLARQAAALDGVHGDSTRVGQWVVATAKAQGVDVSGVKLADTCGLSQGTTLPVRVLGEILARGTSGKDPIYQEIIQRLPVPSWNGTLHDRFLAADAKGARGLIHAKTGSLDGVSSLAGEALTQGHHRVVFAVTTNGTFSDGPVGAKAAIDQLVARLTTVK